MTTDTLLKASGKDVQKLEKISLSKDGDAALSTLTGLIEDVKDAKRPLDRCLHTHCDGGGQPLTALASHRKDKTISTGSMQKQAPHTNPTHHNKTENHKPSQTNQTKPTAIDSMIEHLAVPTDKLLSHKMSCARFVK